MAAGLEQNPWAIEDLRTKAMAFQIFGKII